MALTVHTNRGSYEFDGPYSNVSMLRDQSGVYVITTLSSNDLHDIIDAGESHAVRNRVQNHDRGHLWQNHSSGQLYVSAFYCEEANRMILEQAIRQTHNPPCGKR